MSLKTTLQLATARLICKFNWTFA